MIDILNPHVAKQSTQVESQFKSNLSHVSDVVICMSSMQIINS